MRLAATTTLLLSLAGLPVAAQALCTSDGVPQPVAIVERFINADCEACWRDPAAPGAGRHELAIDWIVPGTKGDDAPLAIGATNDALARLQALGRPVPAGSSFVRAPVAARKAPLRIAQGAAIDNYIGTSIEARRPAPGELRAWLLLVEQLPVGAEGSKVGRNLVRNSFAPDWPAGAKRLDEARPMQIAEGARPARLRLVAFVTDANGRVLAATQTACRRG